MHGRPLPHPPGDRDSHPDWSFLEDVQRLQSVSLPYSSGTKLVDHLTDSYDASSHKVQKPGGRQGERTTALRSPIDVID